MPAATGAPYSLRSCLAWYSWMFMRPAASLLEVGGDAGTGLAQRFDRRDRLVEHFLFGLREVELDDAFDAAGADHDGYAHIEVLDAVLAREVRCAGQHALLVAEVALGHRYRRRGRRIVRRTRLQQAHDLAAALAGALHDRVEPLPGGPAHLDEVGQRDARHRRIAHQRNHVVAVAAERHRRHVLD